MNFQKIYCLSKLIILCVGMSFNSCKAQQQILDAKSKDTFVVSVKDKKTSLPLSTIEKGRVFVQNRGWHTADFGPNFRDNLFLVNQSDTMQLLCFCHQLDNYHFKDIEFKKGTFFVDIAKPLTYRLGKELDLPKTIQETPFKNVLHHEKGNGYELELLSLKEILFKVIDFSDKENIQLILISEDKFWDNNFVPESLKNW